MRWRRTRGPALSLAAVGALLAGCGTEVAGGGDGAEGAGAPAVVSPQPEPPEVTAPSTECPESGARVSPGLIDAAMGLRAGTIQLTNCGDQPYTVEGYPQLTLIDDELEALDVAIEHDETKITSSVAGFDEPQPVTLAPGESATASLVWRNTTDTSGPALDARYVEVVPAPGEKSQTITPDGGIDLGTTGLLGVGPWTRAAVES
ncbi:DUF4232 domain-containing protein [Streptomyces millisiae]|uniref:DUF4232 domain-containing protein n=1 Tax=Streptomyces millisiae TaxID=3075542 RepID=A0ABU2LKD7_9ACTN|nr:DUF4232 domain-containing protein [Streptomyces sp. DSM 44918]MDT0318049.1 DUF4232 domain-containing protein [Streptomyces sp. DSM 44918]